MGSLNIKPSTIFCHDNLEILQGINSDCIDLIYLDPPFNKKKTFTAPIGSASEGASFDDIFREEDVKDEWVRSIKQDNYELHSLLSGISEFSSTSNYCYCVYMAVRLLECQRVLKDTGSLYLHCDPTMSHYLKLVLDCVFGEENFRNEITWCYTGPSSSKMKDFPRKHDVILRYSAGPEWCFNGDEIRVPYSSETLARRGRAEGERSIISASAEITMERRSEKGVKEKFGSGKIAEDWWADIPVLTNQKERRGYPTQKPLALLQRIIRASSNPGDMILDPFCGCATACIAAEINDRRWVGIDVSEKAYELVKLRLKEEVPNEDLFKPEPQFTTTPPKRSRQDVNGSLHKYVYVISNPNFPGEYKVGVTNNVERRLSSYQTGTPDRAYRVEFEFKTKHFNDIEAHIHAVFENKHEWVQGELNDIIKAIKSWRPK